MSASRTRSNAPQDGAASSETTQHQLLSQRELRRRMRVFAGAFDAGRNMREKLVLSAIAQVAFPPDEHVDMSDDLLATMTGLSPRSIRRTVRDLVARGQIRPFRRYELLTPMGQWPRKGA